MTRYGIAATAIVVAALAACGGGATATPNPQAAQASGMQVEELAAGTLSSLPTGTQFVRVLRFQQPAGAGVPSKKHQAGVIYEASGQQLLSYANGTAETLIAGQAVFLASVQHSHRNNGASTNDWYFIALWPSAQRGAPLVSPAPEIALETGDIPSTELPPGAYTETLRKVTLQSGGRSPSHRFAGLEVLYLLSGTLTVDVAGQQPAQLNAAHGMSVAPGTVTQELASSQTSAVYLAFFVSPQGQPFETDVETTP